MVVVDVASATTLLERKAERYTAILQLHYGIAIAIYAGDRLSQLFAFLRMTYPPTAGIVL